jgi:hypothetical protein
MVMTIPQHATRDALFKPLRRAHLLTPPMYCSELAQA